MASLSFLRLELGCRPEANAQLLPFLLEKWAASHLSQSTSWPFFCRKRLLEMSLGGHKHSSHHQQPSSRFTSISSELRAHRG